MNGPFRVVVTGSRNWSDPTFVRRALHKTRAETEPGALVVVQGGAKGADLTAREWAAQAASIIGNVSGETFEAEWMRHGKAAGPLRNERMLKAGADLVLAFPHGGPDTSPGTWNCITQAARMGIPIRIFPKTGLMEETVPA